MAVEAAENGCTVNHGREYMAAVEAGKEVLWMKDFIGELGIRQEEYRLYCDSQSAIHLAKNMAYHSRTKHIQRRYHWIRERVEEREFVLTKIHTTENGLDMLTRALTPDKLGACRKQIGLERHPMPEFVGKHVPPDGS